MSSRTETKTVEIIIKGQQANASLREIQSASRVLNAELKKLPVNSAEFVEKTKELQKVNERLKAITDDVKGVGGVFGQISKEVKAFGLIAMGALGFEFLKNKVSDIIGQNGKLSDSFAEIRRTTGMTADEVMVLNKSFSQMDTRTSTANLRDIAAAAGQLGISKKDILSFTTATDKLVVALGSEFTGGVDEVTKTMGTLRNTFADIKTDNISEDMLHIGNAINELASAGLATGPVVADFANRIGGVGITLGLTSGQVLGMSATLQELNVSTERGGTAVSKILLKMTQNVGVFAKVAGMNAKDFSALVNKDLYGAFMKVVEGSKQGGASATEFSAILDSLGVDGAGASEVFSKLGNNTQLLQEKIDLANVSLAGTDSIMGAFALKNETLGAKVDKLGKQIASVFTSETFNKWVSAGVDGLTDFIGWLKQLPETIQKNYSMLVALSTAILAYNGNLIKSKAILMLDIAAKKLGIATTVTLDGVTRRATAAEVLSNTAKQVGILSQTVWNGLKVAGTTILGIFTGATTLSTVATGIATAAQWAWNAAMLANPIGLVIGLIGGLVAGVMKVGEVMAANKEVWRKAFAEETVRSSNKQLAITKAMMGDIYKLTMLQTELREKEIAGRVAGAKAQWEWARKNKDISAEELTTFTENYKTTLGLQTSLYNHKTQLLEKEIEASKAASNKKVELSAEEAKKQKEALDKLLADHIKLQDEIAKLEIEEYNRGLGKNELELALIDQKYAKLLKDAERFERERQRLMMLWASERSDAEAKQDTEAYKKAKENADKLALAKIKIEDESYLATLSTNDRELAAEMQKWDALIAEAEKNGADTVKLKQAEKDAIDAIVKKQTEKEIETEKEKVDKIRAEHKKLVEERLGMSMAFVAGLKKLYDEWDAEQSRQMDLQVKKNDDALTREIGNQDQFLKAKLVNQKEHDRNVDRLQKEHDRKDAELKHDQFEREKKMKIANALIAGAQGSAQIWGTWAAFPALAAALQIIEAAAVLVAVGNIAKQPNPYAEGGYNRTSDNPQGYTAGATLYTSSASGEPFIAGEKGKEWIMPNWMVQSPAIAPILNMLESVRQNRGYSVGGSNAVMKSGVSSSPSSSTSQSNSGNEVIDRLGMQVERLTTILDNGIAAYLDYDRNTRIVDKINGAKQASRT